MGNQSRQNKCSTSQNTKSLLLTNFKIFIMKLKIHFIILMVLLFVIPNYLFGQTNGPKREAIEKYQEQLNIVDSLLAAEL